jgi:hypothetical protein
MVNHTLEKQSTRLLSAVLELLLGLERKRKARGIRSRTIHCQTLPIPIGVMVRYNQAWSIDTFELCLCLHIVLIFGSVHDHSMYIY